MLVIGNEIKISESFYERERDRHVEREGNKIDLLLGLLIDHV